MLRNETAFVLDVQQHMNFDPRVLDLLMETNLPNNNLLILSWLLNLRHCANSTSLNMNQTEAIIFRTFCSMTSKQWFSFSVLMARHLNVEKLIYRMVLSEDMQGLVGVMLQMTKFLIDMMNKLEPVISRLQTYLVTIQDMNLVADPEFHSMVRGHRVSMSSKATFTTLSRAMCNKGILAVFGISKLPMASESDPSSPNGHQREEMIEKFKIPRNATPFCMNLYLDMVNTTGGAIAWAFLKPMLMGQVLYTPDTPVTRAIMEKSNSTLQEFANLKMYSEDWIESSDYIMKSAKILSNTLPLLQNSLGNSFVKNFIEMQTNINVGNMKETLSNFSNITALLEKKKHVIKQITTLSNLMVNISSCIKFDRFRGYNSADKLNTVAQELAKNRDLYASVIFKLPKGESSSGNSRANSSSSSSSSSSSLPAKVDYTIRMHMDNVMRTDRVRRPYFVKDNHISASQTLRYNRGFIYLQESIDRAIIETQTGQRVAEPAVQLQPFPYPCHIRDEYLEAVSFVFPLLLMIAWVLFVADFVKKLVYERELRLHEYMKMMGVNPLSHFFAWFLECAGYLVFTIIILTLVLKHGDILPRSDGFLLFLYLCDYGLSILAISFLVSSFFDKTYIAGLSGSLIYVLCFFPFIVVIALESKLTFSEKSALGLFAPTCFSYASQYISRYESQGEGIQWSNSYVSPIAGDTSSFGWLCWLMLIDSVLYFIIGAYVRKVFPGKYGIPSPWYFPFTSSFWIDLCCCTKGPGNVGRGLLFTNIMQKNQPVFPDDKGKGQNTFSSQADEEFSGLPVGVALHGLNKTYGEQVAVQNLNVSFYEGHVTSLLGHNGAGKTTTMSLLTGLFAPSSGTIEVYGRDMQANIDDIRRELGVCMQYDVHFDHMTTKEHLLLYGQIKAPHWSRRELQEQVRKILEETGMYAHRHKRVGTLSGGMKRKLSISIAFIGGSRLVVLDEPTTGVDPCSRRSIWDIVIQHKRDRTIIMSTHHLDEAEVLSDRIAFLERGGLKCCGSPFQLKDKLGQGYKLTLTKKIQSPDSRERFDSAELKAFIQAHVPEAQLKEAQMGDLVYSLPPFTSSNASSYRSLLTALDANLDALQLGCYGISDTTLEEVFLQLTNGNPESDAELSPLSVSETTSDSGSIDSLPEDLNGDFGDKIKLTGSSTVRGLALAWQQVTAMLVKRFHHSRRDWKGLISQILLPVLFVVFAMGLGSIKSDLQHFPELELSPALYNIGPSSSFFSNQNPNSSRLADTMMSFPGMDNTCLDKPDNPVCSRNTQPDTWESKGNNSKPFSSCKCTRQEQVCSDDNYQPPHRKTPSSQTVYNLTGVDVENYLIATSNDFIRNRYGGFVFGEPLPPGLQMDLKEVPRNRTLAKVWYNPEGHHTMPAYLNSLNNFILRSNLPADKDPRKYGISISSHPYFGRADEEDSVVQGLIQILVALCVLTGYAITTASFAIYEVHEHHSGSKRLQHIAGIGEPFYWIVNFFYDMVLYLIPVTLTVAVIAAFQIPAFTDRQNLAAVTLLLVLYGFATFPWMYLLSSVFKDAEMAFISYVCINLFISINTIMSSSIVYFLGQIATQNTEAIKETFRKLSYAFLIFPQFSFGNGLMELARVNMEVQILSGYGIDAYKNPFSMDALGCMFISSFIQGLVFFTLRLLLNKRLIRKVRHLILGRKVVPRVANGDEDEDVTAEHLRVAGGAAHSDVLQVNQLTKVYQHLNRKVQAVKRISVGIPAGECFGLLGVNGAGKTTTFKMLTGDVSPTDGTAQIKDIDGRLVDIMECRNKGINIGYCPQVDALDDLLTGEEHLYFYARVRGISKREIDRVVNYLVEKLELGYHRNNITEGYSCGTRRKLSTALALIGHPQILLLDEPSSGMDPRTKRHLWRIISEEVKGKCAVVLTSHSMEECEALCTRLAIMVKGQFRCLGSLQHIKNRFGSGFTVKMYLAQASCDVEAITSFMQHFFPSTYLKDQHSAMVEYHVPVAPGGVADIFDQLESNKTALKIKHFSVSQTTLDEVFINFAMGKIGMETIPIRSEDSDSLDSIEAAHT
ncbi:glucosylceramide transporter ABCA12 [Polymixia lowei]